jgi:hypothetical protein
MKGHTPLVNQDTKDKAVVAKRMKSRGHTARQIADHLGLRSVSRVYELLKQHNWNSGAKK